MLSRFLPKSSHIRLLSNLYSKSPSISVPPRISNSNFILRPFSSNHGNGNGNGNIRDEVSASSTWKLNGEDDDDKLDSLFALDSKDSVSSNHGNNGDQVSASSTWNLNGEDDDKLDSVFALDSKDGVAGISHSPATEERSWLEEEDGDEGSRIFEEVEKDYEARAAGHGDNEWLTSEGHSMWNLEEGEDDKVSKVFDIGEIGTSTSETRSESNVSEEQKILESEKKELTAILKGPNRAFGDLVAASGISDDMLDSLIALKDFEGIEGLPPLSQIEDMRYEKNTRKSARAEIERQKQEEVAKARVRQVDEKGRAYGTGRRKCSIARVWIQPGEGKFVVNDKQFDVYFPMLDHRAALLRPFSETKTLGLWDIDCTVKGGGVSGQVGAIQLGISRALQNWEPDLRPPLKTCGFLTRDPRVVERKKPGKAKARKSFQWVKR
ncbi:small ribosomal subunit protein uS9m-like [Euphorbia lathyris]|uniref:small ribosomal subunit protein uS9m-like n=1 Tax=Euphorbia lathyris TaxID=212925 RepID=UPI0033133F14